MSVIVTDDGFQPDDWLGEVHTMTASDDPAELAAQLVSIGLIQIEFESFADGRGFTLARRLRLMGFKGRLRAKGHVIVEQYTMARRSGFNEVEISDDLAARQPEDQWRTRADWSAHDYQSRLRGPVKNEAPSELPLMESVDA